MDHRRPAMTVDAADAMLTGPGGFLETTTALVDGVEMTVLKNRLPHLRALLANSANHGGDGSARYYVFDNGAEASYRDNLTHAAAVSAALRDRFGVEHGDRVAILAANGPEWIQAFWATVSLGAVAVAMNGWWTGEEISYGLELTKPKVLIADRRLLDRLTTAPEMAVIVIEEDFPALLTPSAVPANTVLANTVLPNTVLPEVDIDEDDPACILFTSGTTGRPKGAVTTHRNFLAYIACAFILGAREAFRFPKPADSPPILTLAASPLFHISGLHSCAVMAIASGVGHVWTTGRFDPEKVLHLTEKYQITRWSGVTTQLWRIIEHPNFARYDTSSVTSIGGGGSAWSPDLIRACRSAVPHAENAIGIGYGLTECSGLATHAGDDLLRHVPDTVGHPIPTCDLAIHDDNDHELADEEIGNVMLRGPMVIPGYWDNAAATAATIRPGRWLRTGDFGYRRDGVLFLVSRRSDLIIRGGENIYPIEIENRLDEHPAVHEVAVVGVDHRTLGQEVKAIVVLREPVSTDDLRAWTAAELASFKVPVEWEIRREPLPRNASGKVLKQVLTGAAKNQFIEE